MKVCSLYGAGYYYIPGTDICLRVGGYVRAEYTYHAKGGMTTLNWTSGGMEQDRTNGNEYVQRAKFLITLESRQQTAYGTLRTYMNVGTSYDSPGKASTSLYANRGFIQLAGFTVGLATSYFDFFSSAATSYTVPWSGDTGDPGWKVFAYTAQLGNGVSASISIEQPRDASLVLNGAVGKFGAAETSNAVGHRHPDVVGNLRIDQAWGSAQVSAAWHDATGGYYGATQGAGHPDDGNGWAAAAGLKLNFPMIGPGDYFQGMITYAQGATGYVANTPSGSNQSQFEGGDKVGTGIMSDAVYGATLGSPMELTTAWGVAAAYEHFWTPSLRTSLAGSYTEISYNHNATALMCANNTMTLTTVGACTDGAFDWSAWTIGSRTQWNVTKEMYMGFDVFYAKLNTMSDGATVVAGAGAQPVILRTLTDQDQWVGRVRWHRDIP